MAPFTEDNHFVQNIGDGTFFHSGSLAVRAAVAAGVNLTYKLLYNSAVAMTGGQDPEGRIGIPALTGWLALEGVTRVVITTPELSNYRGVALDPIAEVRHRDELAAVEAELARVEGVTVLIHDDRCAAEERRLRKRGELATPSERVWINQRVCEGCGDCASVSSCLSVVPVDTEFGRKTAIHQSSCNQDLSCLKGNCPSFVVVTPGRRSRGSTSVADPPITPPPPRFRRPDADHLIRMPGIGGAGVVTASKVLQQAARLDGWSVAALDQTGLAQKGGPVISDVRLSRAPIQGSVGATKESVDVLIAFDTVTAGGMSALATTRSAHTVVVVDTAQVPTASMVRDPASIYPGDDLLTVIDASTSMEDNIRIPARWIAERLFADHIPANMVLLGAAYQHGCLPIEGDAIEAAIRLSSSNAEVNLKAFHWGRAAVADLHATVGALTSTPAAPTIDPAVSDLVAPRDVPSEMVASLRRCVQELSDYQDIRVARGYLDHVMHVTEIERDRLGHGQSRIATAYALQLFKLTAYKDEYEVARLHLDPIEQSRLESEFGTGARTRVMLHPPLLRSLGLRHKISLGRATRPAFKILYAARFMRGSSFDLFGRSPVRRIERSLPAEYRSHVGYALEHLKPETVDLVLAIVNAPDVIRGYEEIKLRNVARYRAMVDELLNELDGMVGAPTSH
jgi:indolepyruvate ferredoxin oxidoreductase